MSASSPRADMLSARGGRKEIMSTRPRRVASLQSLAPATSLIGFSRLCAIYYALTVFYEPRSPRSLLCCEASGPFDIDDRARHASLTVKHGERSGDAFSQQRASCITLRVTRTINNQFAAADHRIRITGAAANPERVEPRGSAALDFCESHLGLLYPNQRAAVGDADQTNQIVDFRLLSASLLRSQDSHPTRLHGCLLADSPHV